jgi:6-pyruvoyltetrahydropterin/6-carboxytetrahydropterin synthase
MLIEGESLHSIHVSGHGLDFSSAHFVESAGVCETLHGHNYTVDIDIAGPLDDDGMVVDFAEIKDTIRRMCKELDHKILLPGKSKTISLKESKESIDVKINSKRYVFPTEDCVIMPIVATTVELLAEYFVTNLEFPEEYSVKLCVSESNGAKGCFSSPS